MRDQTEWIELLENKVNLLVGANENKIINGVKEMLSRNSNFEIDLYGNGKACDIIAEELIKNT